MQVINKELMEKGFDKDQFYAGMKAGQFKKIIVISSQRMSCKIPLNYL